MATDPEWFWMFAIADRMSMPVFPCTSISGMVAIERRSWPFFLRQQADRLKQKRQD